METTVKIADRCDRCGARAYAIAFVNGVRLLFCGHHFAEHETALRIEATRVIDLREEIPA